VAEAYCSSRLDGAAGLEYGTLDPGLELDRIIERATPIAEEQRGSAGLW
jgi:hypothetical protein